MKTTSSRVTNGTIASVSRRAPAKHDHGLEAVAPLGIGGDGFQGIVTVVHRLVGDPVTVHAAVLVDVVHASVRPWA